MTAFTMQDEIGNILANGLDDYITKPIRSEALIQKVYEWSDERFIESKEKIPAPEIVKKERAITPPDGNAILDLTVAEDLSKFGDHDFLVFTYEDFAKECLDLLNSMASDLSKGNFVQFKRDIHTLKGTSQTLGLQQLARLAIKSEQRIIAGDYSSIQEDFLRIKKAYDRFRNSYKQILRDLTK
jgi:HPt (histidine-containing phosphotransfer) domain-containing protein